jgi:hypothetical protein
MKICDNNWNDPSGGHTVEVWESKQPGCLAISVADQHNAEERYQTATLTATDCFALGMELLRHAAKHGVHQIRLMCNNSLDSKPPYHSER